MAKGRLYLLPTLMGSENWEHVIPKEVAELAIKTRYFAVEDLKSARRYLRKLDRTFPIDQSTFFILNKKTPPTDLAGMLAPLRNGHDVAIIRSEEHTSELQSRPHLVCRLLLEKKK